MGRPSSYDPSHCQTLIAHMREGLSFQSFAGLVEVSRKTLYNWLKAHPEFKEAKALGDSLSYLWWDKFYKDAMKGKERNANATLIIFAMKNRFGWRDRQPEEDKPKPPSDPVKGIEMTPENIALMIKAAREGK